MHSILEEILEAIWKADEEDGATIEEVRRCCPKEISDADLEALEKQGFITVNGGSVSLTASGRKEAETIVRRHRLAEVLLATVLNLDPETQEKIACEVEHYVAKIER